MISSIIIQLLLSVLFLMLLDGGFTARVGGYSMIGFWIGVAIVMLRRPRDPKPSDLAYVRYGYPAIFVIGLLISIAVLYMRRHP
ncbi:MAG TPA: hypothetical protein VFW23_01065 [Tepidisphaeraceae bacterium]|nr:hypothetical protein [Tepidisphaeraceae bacterium]